jgi:uncharacterized 2Fe-2S/4Fe-4S cluster protein (DUF4445 family)
MSATVRIRLEPLGASFEAPRGVALQDILPEYGVEFPCGGQAQCKGCRIKVLSGNIPLTPGQEQILSPEECAAGWRLACRSTAGNDLTIELAQWEAVILADESTFAFTPREGLGIAVDVGTTTLAAQILDLATGNVLAVRTALNAQAKHGADIMSRIGFAVAGKGLAVLTGLIREEIGRMAEELLRESGRERGTLREIVLVGNTAMHHLFSGIDCTPLSRYPFEPERDGLMTFTSRDLGWTLGATPSIRFLPCLGGFVGSDILAGVIATNLYRSNEPVCLIDLGTNGEIVIGAGGRLLCCSTAAGPAFEGARISMGMRAVTGAIAEVQRDGNQIVCRTFGNGTPRGICGSGLVDAAAVLLDLDRVSFRGRIAGGGEPIVLAGEVALTQTDIRELQLAKGAIAAGIRILLRELQLEQGDIRTVYLAGAFGNYVKKASAHRIGLLPFSPDTITSSGNTALRGAKRMLFDDADSVEALAGRIEHISLHAHRDFQDIYVDEMSFPRASKQ